MHATPLLFPLRFCMVLMLLAAGPALTPAWAADRQAPDGQAGGAQGRMILRATGSDTLRPILRAWWQAYAPQVPGWRLQVDSNGSATAIAALADALADIGAMSRPASPPEAARFRAVRGRAPLAITVAMDAIAVIVHPDNPVQGLTMAQLDGIFSADPLCGGRPTDTWRQLVVGGSDGAIVLHGRSALSGTHEVFRDRVLCGGAFRARVVEHGDSRALVAAVAADPLAIGYVGLGYVGLGFAARGEAEGRVATLAIGEGRDLESARFYPFIVEAYRNAPDPELKYAYIFEDRYPLARPLLLYVDRPDGGPLPAPLRGFLEFALSAEGQQIVEAQGFVPLSDRRAAAQRAKLEPDDRPPRSWLPWN